MVKQHIHEAHLGEWFEILRVERVCKSHWNCLCRSSWLWQNNTYHLAEPIWLQLLKAILRGRIGWKLRISWCHLLNLEHCIGRINHIESDTLQYAQLTGQACSLGTYCHSHLFHFAFSTVNGPHNIQPQKIWHVQKSGAKIMKNLFLDSFQYTSNISSKFFWRKHFLFYFYHQINFTFFFITLHACCWGLGASWASNAIINASVGMLLTPMLYMAWKVHKV